MRSRPILTLFLISFLGISGAQAVVTTVDAITDNTIAPADDPGFANVGIVNGASGVYIGDRWMLTASHVGAGTTTFPSLGAATYAVEGGSTTILSNDVSFSGNTGYTVASDMTLFRLATEPVGLPTLTLSTGFPVSPQPVVMVGRGFEQQTTLSTWEHTVIAGVGNDTWVSPGGAPNESGYVHLSSRLIRWGENDVDSAALTAAVVTGRYTLGFTTLFEDGIQDEGQGAAGDSGGAVFVKNGANWELVGIMSAITLLDNQPTNASIYGQETFAASTAIYRDEIIGLTGIPEPSSALLIALGGFALGLRRRR